MNLKTFLNSTLFLLLFIFTISNINTFAASKINLDYDGKADFLIYRKSLGQWHGYSSETGEYSVIQWGLETDKPVPADYDGDGLTDRAVYRPETGVWYILRSTNLQMMVFNWGLSDDEPVPADFDGDGATDIAVYRRSNRIWYVLPTKSGYNPLYFQLATPENFPIAGSVPAPADFDGDGKDDFAVNYISYWFYYSSLNQKMVELRSQSCTQGYLAPGDYDGNGTDDPSCVYFLFDVRYFWRYTVDQNSETTQIFWGRGPLGDLPAPDDYDGDGIIDIAVFRSPTGQWWIKESSTQEARVFVFGKSQDVPAQFINLYQYP